MATESNIKMKPTPVIVAKVDAPTPMALAAKSPKTSTAKPRAKMGYRALLGILRAGDMARISPA